MHLIQAKKTHIFSVSVRSLLDQRSQEFSTGKKRPKFDPRVLVDYIELTAKLLDYFLRSNKSNISQTISHVLKRS